MMMREASAPPVTTRVATGQSQAGSERMSSTGTTPIAACRPENSPASKIRRTDHAFKRTSRQLSISLIRTVDHFPRSHYMDHFDTEGNLPLVHLSTTWLVGASILHIKEADLVFLDHDEVDGGTGAAGSKDEPAICKKMGGCNVFRPCSLLVCISHPAPEEVSTDRSGAPQSYRRP